MSRLLRFPVDKSVHPPYPLKLRYSSRLQFFRLIPLRCGTTSHIRFATTFTTGDRPEFLDEFSSHQSVRLRISTTKGTEVESASIVHDQESSTLELFFLQSVHQLLQQISRTFKNLGDVAAGF